METEAPTAVLLIAGAEVFHLLRPFLETPLQRSNRITKCIKCLTSQQLMSLMRQIKDKHANIFQGYRHGHTSLNGHTCIHGHISLHVKMWQSMKNYLFVPPSFCFLSLYFILKRTLKCIILYSSISRYQKYPFCGTD